MIRVVHQQLAATMDRVFDEIGRSSTARERRRPERGPLADDRAALPQGLDRTEDGGRPPVEGTWRAHQVPLAGARQNPEHLAELEEWMR